jgi:hypothetical protein
MRAEIDPIFETSCSLVFRIPDDERNPETQKFSETCIFIGNEVPIELPAYEYYYNAGCFTVITKHAS